MESNALHYFCVTWTWTFVPKVGPERAFVPDCSPDSPEAQKCPTHSTAPACSITVVWQPLCSPSAHHLYSVSASHHRWCGWRIPCLRLQPLSPGLRLGLSFYFYFLNMSRAWLFVFNTISYIYSKYKSPPKSAMNKPQAEGKIHSHLYSRTQEKKFNTLQQ